MLVRVRGSKSDSHRQKLQATVIFFERCLVVVVVVGRWCEEPEREWAVNTEKEEEDVRAGLREEEGDSRGSCFEVEGGGMEEEEEEEGWDG